MHDQEGSTLPPPRPGSCSCESGPGNALVYRLSGDLDLASPDALAFAKPLDGFHSVVVDLTTVGFFGSTALNALLRLRLDAEAFGILVHLCAPPQIVARVLEITGADTVFPIHPDLGTALRSAAA